MADFPKGFLWGAASASYQIEGGVNEGGRGRSIWDVFAHTPGRIKNDDTGDVACDSYHRWREDIQLIKDMGLGAYRFSVAWPRIAPKGNTDWNQPGFDYCDGIVNALLEAGIEPWVTLYHWDLPQALEAKGGWQNPETAHVFAAYAEKMAEHFKGRVRRWITLNEPQCFIGVGCGSGEHAPGLTLTGAAYKACWRNARLAHVLAADAIHRADQSSQVGLSSTGNVWYPASDREEDAEAARRLMFAEPQGPGSFLFGMALDGMRDKLDFIGINVYHGTAARMGENGPEPVDFPAGYPHTAMDWPVTPEALEWGPRLVYERYGLPVYITENGLSCRDWVSLDGRVHDPQRIDFLTRYLRALSRAIAAGADVRGYFHWSLTDNFEWAEGYSQRFGLVYVDYPTGTRIPKDSAGWYKEVAASGGVL